MKMNMIDEGYFFLRERITITVSDRVAKPVEINEMSIILTSIKEK